MEVRDKERYIVSLASQQSLRSELEYWHWLPSQDDKTLCTPGKEPGKFMSKNPFDIIRLLDLDANPDCIDGRLNQNLLILVTSNMHWIQDDF